MEIYNARIKSVCAKKLSLGGGIHTWVDNFVAVIAIHKRRSEMHFHKANFTIILHISRGKG